MPPLSAANQSLSLHASVKPQTGNHKLTGFLSTLQISARGQCRGVADRKLCVEASVHNIASGGDQKATTKQKSKAESAFAGCAAALITIPATE